MDRSTVRTLARAKGASVQTPDDRTDWFAFPSEESLLQFRTEIPYQATYTGEGPKGGYRLTVYYDLPRKADPTEIDTAERLLLAVLLLGDAIPTDLRNEIRAFIRRGGNPNA